jgi:hypothetical protein
VGKDTHVQALRISVVQNFHLVHKNSAIPYFAIS